VQLLSLCSRNDFARRKGASVEALPAGSLVPLVKARAFGMTPSGGVWRHEDRSHLR